MSPQDAVFSGATIGLMITAPIGPMGILCIKRTLSAGFGAGLSTGAGARPSKSSIPALPCSGCNQLVRGWRHTVDLLGALAAAIMLSFAFRTLRPRSANRAAAGASHRSLLGNYVSAAAFNPLNPMLLVLLTGAITSIVVPRQPGGGEHALLLLGVFLGSIVVVRTDINAVGADFSSAGGGWYRAPGWWMAARQTKTHTNGHSSWPLV